MRNLHPTLFSSDYWISEIYKTISSFAEVKPKKCFPKETISIQRYLTENSTTEKKGREKKTN